MTSAPSRGTSPPWWAFLAVGAIACLLRWPIADLPLERDEGEYAYIAQRWWLGEVPYRDSFDQKPPGAFVAYAVFLKLFGESPAALHWGTQLYTFGTLGLIFLVGRRLFGAWEGLLAALLAAFLTADASVLGSAANTETFMILPLTAAYLATLQARESGSRGLSLLAGVSSALALLCKQVALPNVALHAGLLLQAAPAGRLLLPFLVGSVAGLAPAAGYFFAAGALRDLWDCVVVHNLFYAQRLPLAQYPVRFWGTFQFVLRYCWAVLLLATIGAWKWTSGTETETEARRARDGQRLILLWLLFSAIGVGLGGYFRDHYYIQAIPPVAVLAGRGATVLARALPRPWPLVGAGALSLAAILAGVLATPWYYLHGTPAEKSRLLYEDCPFVESRPVADFLRARTGPEDRVFIYGSEPQILFYAGRASASRYIFVYPLMTSFADTRARQLGVIRELHERPPRFLVRVHVDGSFLEDERTPADLRRYVAALGAGEYAPVGWVRDGDASVRQWPDRAALEPGRWPNKATLTLWERVRVTAD